MTESCEFCGNKVATLIGHLEKHLVAPRKINICNGCHLALHRLPLQEQCCACQIPIPRSSLPFFRQLYANIADARGNIILSGELLFNARYKVVKDEEWKGAGLLDAFKNLMPENRRRNNE